MTSGKFHVCCVFLAFLSGISFCEPAFGAGSPPSAFSHAYLKVPDSLLRAAQFETAMAAYMKARARFEREGLWAGIVRCNNKISHCYRRLGKYEEMLALLKTTLDNANLHLGAGHVLTAETLFYFGEYYFRKNEPDQALKQYDKALGILQQQTNTGDCALEFANVYSGIAAVYQYSLLNFEKAEAYFNKALDIRSKLLREDDFDLAVTYYGLASAYMSIGNYELAETHGIKASDLSQKHPNEKTFQANCLQAVGNLYFVTFRFKKAIEYYKPAIDLLIAVKGPNDLSLVTYYNNLGTVYNEMKDHSRALYYFRLSLRINRLNDFGNVPEQSASYFNFGIVHQFLKTFDSSAYYYRKSLAIRTRFYGLKNKETSDCYRYLAELYEEHGRFDSALYYFQQALISGLEDFNVQDIHIDPFKEQIGLNQHAILTLWKKGRTLKARYNSGAGDISMLTQALRTFSLADSAIVIYKDHFYKEGTKLMLSYVFKSMYEDALETCYLLSRATNDVRYNALALRFMEQTKAMYLRESIERSRELHASGIPDSILVYDASLISELGKLKELQLEAERSQDTVGLKDIKSRIFVVSEEHENLNRQLRKNYPDHFTIQSDDLIAQVKRQDAGSALIEYFWGDHWIFSIASRRGKMIFYRVPLSPAIRQAIAQFKNELTGDVDYAQARSHFQNFTGNAVFLYKNLLEPLLRRMNAGDTVQNLIIVPDGALAYIPFDAFLEKYPAITSEVNYKKLPYLINRYAIRYEYSLALMGSLKRGDAAVKGNLLAFAYSARNARDSGSAEVAKRALAGELPGSSREIDAIASVMKGKYLFDTDASEANFKKYGSDYRILHFALHGMASDSASSARLIFKNMDDSLNDGALYPYELYNVKLNSELVVLSACETGIGKMHDGEGIYSMARGFVYAGCPSVIMTLWKVNDHSTAIIMAAFYRNLSEGFTIDASLRQSKLLYIQEATAMGAHPSQWATAIPLGEMSALSDPFAAFRIIGLILFLIILMTGLVFIFKKSRSTTTPFS
jgi:CHAT domain-containing protein/Tfp pilus assembly protein PilF